jgi:hypothetical protein
LEQTIQPPKAGEETNRVEHDPRSGLIKLQQPIRASLRLRQVSVYSRKYLGDLTPCGMEGSSVSDPTQPTAC